VVVKKSKEFDTMTKLLFSRLPFLRGLPALMIHRSMRTGEGLCDARQCKVTVAGVREKVAKQPQSELREGWLQCESA
jgi:hypothetical protein